MAPAAVLFGVSSFSGFAASGSSPGGATESAASDFPVAALPYLRLMAEQSSRPVAYPLRSSHHGCMMSII